MNDFICNILPVLAFLTGTVLGGLIMYLFNRAHRKSLEAYLDNASKTNQALESQLISKSQLENDLARTNTELENLRLEIKGISQPKDLQPSNLLKEENATLRKKIKKLETFQLAPKKNYVNDYQLFLLQLEKSIKKAKKKTFEKPAKSKEAPIAKKKKNKKKKSTSSKYDFYKQKFSKPTYARKDKSTSSQSLQHLTGATNSVQVRDLTYLYGITPEIQEILNQHGIKTYTDLSLTKIAELKAILNHHGEGFENADPLNWPIQARIAEKGQWEILDEYKSKMEG